MHQKRYQYYGTMILRFLNPIIGLKTRGTYGTLAAKNFDFRSATLSKSACSLSCSPVVLYRTAHTGRLHHLVLTFAANS